MGSHIATIETFLENANVEQAMAEPCDPTSRAIKRLVAGAAAAELLFQGPEENWKDPLIAELERNQIDNQLRERKLWCPEILAPFEKDGLNSTVYLFSALGAGTVRGVNMIFMSRRVTNPKDIWHDPEEDIDKPGVAYQYLGFRTDVPDKKMHSDELGIHENTVLRVKAIYVAARQNGKFTRR